MFTLQEDKALPGLANLVALQPGLTPNDEVVAEFGRRLQASDLPVAPTMGLTSGLRELVERILFRKLVREEAPTKAAVPWFECHVPPGGSATVRSSTTRSSDMSCELTVYGSGLGGGRKTTLSVSTASSPRKACAIYSLDYSVTSRIYDVRGRESIELEVVAFLGESIRTLDPCPFCGVSPDDIDEFEFRRGDYLDLRSDLVPTDRTFDLTVEGEFSASVSLNAIPGLKLGAKVSRGMTLQVADTFLPGLMYYPYTRVPMTSLQTSMWATAADYAHVDT